MKRIKELDKLDRPREKLALKGPKALSDLELLQALIGSGNKYTDVSSIAREVKKLLRKHGSDISYNQLKQVTGLGTAKVTEILASIELSKRYLVDDDRPIIDSPEKAAEQLSDIRDKKQEYLIVMTLDGANRLIEKRTIAIGTLTNSLVHPREVFADAITDRAAGIIVAHNHPGGSLEPSKADLEVTTRLKACGQLLGIIVIDHIVITNSKHTSLMVGF
ncbi:MAG: DNA repair protein RadC [Candidatus Saccharimonadales bacterium]